jgi:ribose transport system substrate-binding protein
MMNRFVRTVLGLSAAIGLVALPVACNRDTGPKKTKIVYITNCVADFWTIAKAGTEKAAKEFDVDVEVLMPKNLEDQQRMVQDSVGRGAAGIAISPINAENSVGLINDAASRTKVITHDSDSPKSNRLAYIGMDNYDAGRICGQMIKEALPNGGSIAIFVGLIEQDNARRRRQGIIDELLDRPRDPSAFDKPGAPIKGEKYEIVETLFDNMDPKVCKNNAQDVMGKYPKLSAMVGLFEYSPPAILEALGDKAGRDIKVIAFDEADMTLKAIQDGRCYGTVVQDPYMYGYQSVKLLAALAKGDQSALPEGKFMNIAARQIKKDGVDQFWSEKKARLAK